MIVVRWSGVSRPRSVLRHLDTMQHSGHREGPPPGGDPKFTV